MKIRIEPFVQGFMTGLKPQMTPQDRELLALIFKNQKPYTHSSRDELNPAKAAYYFRFRNNHLNVLLPTWLLNGKRSAKGDRFRIGCTEDHSVIIDSKESIVYDPTIETAHALPEYRAFLAGAEWKDETGFRLRDELLHKRIAVCCFYERIEHIPALYDAFSTFIFKSRMKDRVPDFRFGLKLDEARRETAAQAAKDRVLIEIAMDELWQRARKNAA